MLARCPRPLALGLIALFLAALGWCLVAPGRPAAAAAAGGFTDVRLYQDIVAAVGKGERYHHAATRLQREHDYPTRPFVTVREPTLYVVAARLGWERLQLAASALVLANILAWAFALPAQLNPIERLLAVTGVAAGGAAVAAPALLAMTELWCGLLLGLALALTIGWKDRWWLPLPVIALALALRELALPFLLLSAAFALVERNWRALAAWGAILLLFAMAMGWHAVLVNSEVHAGDIVSPGWSGGQGLCGFLMAVAYTSVWQQLPQSAALALALLPALGWLALEGRGGLFAVLLLGGYGLMIALFSRHDNFYWGLLVMPAWFVGYALIPRALLQLRAVLRG